MHVGLVTLGVFGAASLYGDGIITPAISVLSAVEGLGVATPIFEPFVDSDHDRDPRRDSSSFSTGGPRRSGGLRPRDAASGSSTLATLGLASILRYPAVLVAVNPLHAAAFFAHNRFHGFLVLGAVFLVATGGEALYADLGHFGEMPIQIDWFSFVGPSLLLNYFGQGALLIRDPAAAENPFFQLAPPWALYPLVAPRDDGDDHRVAGDRFRRLFADPPGGPARVPAEGQDRPHVVGEIGQIYIPGLNWC